LISNSLEKINWRSFQYRLCS